MYFSIHYNLGDHYKFANCEITKFLVAKEIASTAILNLQDVATLVGTIGRGITYFAILISNII